MMLLVLRLNTQAKPDYRTFSRLTIAGMSRKSNYREKFDKIIIRRDENFGGDLIIKNYEDLSTKLEYWLKADDNEVKAVSEKMRRYVIENHSLVFLANKLTDILKRNV